MLEEVESILRWAWKRARALVEHEKISHRQTACRIAVRQVHEAMKLRGFCPVIDCFMSTVAIAANLVDHGSSAPSPIYETRGVTSWKPALP